MRACAIVLLICAAGSSSPQLGDPRGAAQPGMAAAIDTSAPAGGLCNSAVPPPRSVWVARFHATRRVSRTVRRTPAVGALYAVLCGLTRVPFGRYPYSCPPSNAVTYRLGFYGGTMHLLQVVARAAGCEWLIPANQRSHRTAYWLSSSFWDSLARVLGTRPLALTPEPDPTVP